MLIIVTISLDADLSANATLEYYIPEGSGTLPGLIYRKHRKIVIC